MRPATPFISQIALPNSLRAVDDLIRADLEAYSGWWFSWLLIATGVVVLGLLFEFPEIWHETSQAIRGLLQPATPERQPATPELHMPAWVKLMGTLGWVLIVAGVAGEFVTETFVSKADGLVRKFDEMVLADTQKASSFAGERAASAYERAEKTEQEASQENERAAKSLEASETARKEAEGFNLQISQANERASKNEKEAAQLRKDAAQLREDAEAERLARVSLEQKLAWRSLTTDQSERIASKLRQFVGQQFDFVTFSNEGECLNFQNVLYRVLLSGQWMLDPNRKWGMLIMSVVGLKVQFSEGADQHTKDAATTLIRALNDENLSATPDPILLKDAPKNEIIKIVVGKSPASMEPIE